LSVEQADAVRCYHFRSS